MTPDLHTLKSLRSIYDQVDFRRFREFLEAVEKEETHRAIHATENSDVARGRAQMISWVLQQIETCKQAADKMEIRHERSTQGSSRRG